VVVACSTASGMKATTFPSFALPIRMPLPAVVIPQDRLRLGISHIEVVAPIV
jgi:hypothetical protein